MRNHAVIIGAGPAGLCLSLALAARGFTIDLIDSKPEAELAAPQFDGREIAMKHASIRILRDLGVWGHLPADAAAPLRQALVMDGQRPGFVVDGTAIGQDHLGMFVSNMHIRAAAWQAVAATPAVRVQAGARMEALNCDPAAGHVVLDDGRTLKAPLIVAADSRFSSSRRMMGIPVHMHDFGRSMFLCRVSHSTPSRGVAWEWFGPDQGRARLPLAEHLSSVVITVPASEAQELLTMPATAFAAEIERRFEGRLGTVEEASTRHAYPLVATWARRFIGQRFALVGDAAVGMHPVTAHGFNLGLASVESMAAAAAHGLQQYNDPGHPQVLARYERDHRASSGWIFAGTQTVLGLFTSDRPLAQPLRRAVIGIGRRLPPLPRLLAAELVDAAPRPRPALRRVVQGVRALAPSLPHPRRGIHLA